MPVKDIEQHNGYELDRVFGIRRHPLIEKIIVFIYEEAHKIQHPLLRKIFFKFLYNIKEKNNYDFNQNLLKPQYYRKFTFFFGGWHSEKYFKSIKEEIKTTFNFDESKLNCYTKKWKETIKSKRNTCSIHVRRGDYLVVSVWNGCATDEYYYTAIKYIRECISEDTLFFVFSNDIEWCRKHFGEENFNYIDCNKGNDSWMDMYLMSICHHHINANSTFSWWGAWLCKHKDSITIVPKRFQNNQVTKDIYPEEWIKL